MVYLFQIPMDGIYVAVADDRNSAEEKVKAHIKTRIKKEYYDSVIKDIEFLREVSENDGAIRIG